MGDFFQKFGKSMETGGKSVAECNRHYERYLVASTKDNPFLEQALLDFAPEAAKIVTTICTRKYWLEDGYCSYEVIALTKFVMQDGRRFFPAPNSSISSDEQEEIYGIFLRCRDQNPR